VPAANQPPVRPIDQTPPGRAAIDTVFTAPLTPVFPSGPTVTTPVTVVPSPVVSTTTVESKPSNYLLGLAALAALWLLR